MSSKPTWNPRGEPTWPNAKTAKTGTRVEHVRSGRTGTLVRIVMAHRGVISYAVIRWDNDNLGRLTTDPGRQVVGRVVAPVYELCAILGA